MDLKYFVWKNPSKTKRLMHIPKVKAETVESIIEEIYAKNKTFGVREFQSNIGREKH